MIIPIGHEQTTVRRLPWISISIMVLCFLAYVYSFHVVGLNDTEIQRRLDNVISYYQGHPYLAPDARLKELLEEMFPPGYLEKEEEVRPTDFGKKRDRERIATEQLELDSLTNQFFEALEDNPIWRWGLVPAKFSFVTLITYMFMHGGFLHLLGNLFFLYLSGPFIEDRWGRPLFAGFYLLAGVVSAALFAARYDNLQVPLVGASGAVAGCMGAFLLLYAKIKIRFFYWIGWFWRGTFSAPAWLMLIVWFSRELMSAKLMDSLAPGGGGGGVAYWAHVWGFVFGAGVGGVMRLLRIEEKYIHHKIESKTTLVSNPVIDQALQVKDQGNPEQALQMLHAEARRDPSNIDVALSCWHLAVEVGRASVVAPVILRLVRHEIREGHIDTALAHWTELRETAPEAPVDVQVAAKLSDALAKVDWRGDAINLLQTALDSVSSNTPAGVLVMLIRLASSMNHPVPPGAVEVILAHPEIPPAVKKGFSGPGHGKTAARRGASPPKPPKAKNYKVPPQIAPEGVKNFKKGPPPRIAKPVTQELRE